jgi:hypothetical protein
MIAKNLTRFVLCVVFVTGLASCVAAYPEPPARPPGVAYVEPVGPAPGPGYLWRWHHSHGWGWWHPHRGWQYGWR